MGKGLREYDQNDALFSKAIFPRFFLTSIFTLGWFGFAKFSRVFTSQQSLIRSIPVAAALAFYLTKSMSYYYVATKDSLQKNQAERNNENEQLKRHVRNYLSSH
jgi:hypothetical protein